MAFNDSDWIIYCQQCWLSILWEVNKSKSKKRTTKLGWLSVVAVVCVQQFDFWKWLNVIYVFFWAKNPLHPILVIAKVSKRFILHISAHSLSRAHCTYIHSFTHDRMICGCVCEFVNKHLTTVSCTMSRVWVESINASKKHTHTHTNS